MTLDNIFVLFYKSCQPLILWHNVLKDNRSESFLKCSTIPANLLMSIPSFEMTLRPSDHEMSWKTISIEILLGHKSSDLNKTYLLHKLYHGEKEELDAYWLGTSSPLPNGIKKLLVLVPPNKEKTGTVIKNTLYEQKWQSQIRTWLFGRHRGPTEQYIGAGEKYHQVNHQQLSTFSLLFFFLINK